MKDITDRLQKTNGYRTQINYPYWQTLSEAEQEERTVEARKLIYDAEQANANADIDTAIELYEKAFTIWAEIFDDYPILTMDDTADDLTDSIRHYMIAIDSEDFPEDFPLMSFIELQSQDPSLSSADSYQRLRAAMRKAAEQEDEEKPAGADSPKSDSPKSDSPKSDSPKSDSPKSDSPKSDSEESIAPAPTAEPAGGNEAEKSETKSNEPQSPESESPSAEPAQKEAGEATEAGTATAETQQADADNADTPKSEGDTAEDDSDEV
jgi:hypothetical protein